MERMRDLPLHRTAVTGVLLVALLLLASLPLTGAISVAGATSDPYEGTDEGVTDGHDHDHSHDEATDETGDSGASFQAEGDNPVLDITFPYPEDAEYHYSDTYTACRSGCSRTHRATDIMAQKMTTVHAVVDGIICFAPGIDEPMPSYGYMIRLCGDDGYRYAYVHLNNDTPTGDPANDDDGMGGPENAYAPGIEEGVRVTRGQHIGWVGDSGNAESTAPHIHFEISEDPSSDVRNNPVASLQAAEERGDFPDAVTPMPTSSPTPEESEDDPADDRATGVYTRLSGSNRLQTAVALSQETHTSARSVIIVPADSHVEALVAAPLAALIDAPILLAGPDGLDRDVTAEVERLDPLNAYVIGDTDQLPAGIEQELTDAGVRNQARITARDRYALSAAVAREVLSYPQAAEVDRMILALGDADEASRAWPDALSASALAAHTITPILLTEGDRLPDAVADLLTEERPSDLIVVGGTSAIEEAVAEEAGEIADATVERLSGATRYATSVAVAAAARAAGLDGDAVWVATGRNFPDALAAGPAAARSGSPLVLVDGLAVAGAPDSADWLAANAGSLVVVGGQAAITDDVAEGLAG